MPHITVEYTANLKEDSDIKGLLGKINKTLIEEGDTFPIGGIRSRAIALDDYVIADGTGEEDAFVHVTIKIGSGRSEDVRKRVCDKVFEVVEDHFGKQLSMRPLALSLELFEFMYPTYKKNTIHQRYR